MSNEAGAAQLNVRLDRSLRDAGNAALSSVGLTPSEYIRALWSMLARRGADLAEAIRPVESFQKKVTANQSAHVTPLEVASEQRGGAATSDDPFDAMLALIASRPKLVETFREADNATTPYVRTSHDDIEDALAEQYLIKAGSLGLDELYTDSGFGGEGMQ